MIIQKQRLGKDAQEMEERLLGTGKSQDTSSVGTKTTTTKRNKKPHQLNKQTKPPKSKTKQNTPPKNHKRVVNQKTEQTNLETTVYTFAICNLSIILPNLIRILWKSLNFAEVSQIRHLVNFKTRPKRNQVSAASKLDCDTSKHQWSL